MTISQRRILQGSIAKRRKHVEDCPRCAQDDLVCSLRGSLLWQQISTPLSKLIDHLRGQGGGK